MKNEDRILELLAETLQRIDIQQKRLEEMSQEQKQHNLRLEQQGRSLEQQGRSLKQQGQSLEQQAHLLSMQQENSNMLVSELQLHREKLEKYGDGLGTHNEAIAELMSRSEAMHLTSLEQQEAYRAMTQLLMKHHQALLDKNIL
ncbi:hypothetical protein [Tellurirhabdus rosea]|uniref:hypothetical protein n=1 Tax=Tellurirhabdus rosea TaxID=2674997 RepID=UPI002259EE37|nr:hypothetical protein [Tellurirhabdus rosea]